MIVSYRPLFIALVFFCIANVLSAQEEVVDDEILDDEAVLFLHRFAWAETAYAFRYEVLIEQEQDGVYTNVFREFTYESYIFALLPLGTYRVRVIPYDIRNLPGEEAPWRYFNVSDLLGEDPDIDLAMEDLPYLETVAEERRRGMFIGASANVLGYSPVSITYGGGLTFGVGFNNTNMGVGLSLIYAQDMESFIYLEALALFRLYFSRARNHSGLFVQLGGGIVLFSFEQPEITDIFSPVGGLGLGWRIPLGRRWYIEPNVHGGFPYMFGGGLTIGIR